MFEVIAPETNKGWGVTIEPLREAIAALDAEFPGSSRFWDDYAPGDTDLLVLGLFLLSLPLLAAMSVMMGVMSISIGLVAEIVVRTFARDPKAGGVFFEVVNADHRERRGERFALSGHLAQTQLAAQALQKAVDGLPQVFAVNTLAPYILTALLVAHNRIEDVVKV